MFLIGSFQAKKVSDDNEESMSEDEMFAYKQLQSARIEVAMEHARKHKTDLPRGVAFYIANIKNSEGRHLSAKGIEQCVLRTIAYASFTHRRINIELVSEVAESENFGNEDKYGTPSNPMDDEGDYLFDPKSKLELQAYAMYEQKFGHIPVRDLTDDQLDEQCKMFFSVLEFLKEEQIRAS